MPIYTKTGDDGTTALFGGKRVLKCDELVDVYGSIDELNSWIGFVLTGNLDTKLKDFLTNVQSDLFTVGSILAGWNGELRDMTKRVSQMEKLIDTLDAQLPPLTNFILPGGSPMSANMHIARSICRRVERQTVALKQKQSVDPIIVQYLNRLSDLLFVMARYINKNARIPDILWSGMKKRR